MGEDDLELVLKTRKDWLRMWELEEVLLMRW